MNVIRHTCLLVALLFAVGATAQSGPRQSDDANEAIVDGANADISARWPELAQRVEVRVLRMTGDEAEMDGDLRVRLLTDAPPRGRTSAELHVRDASGSWRRVGWALLEVAWFGEAVILTESVQRGAPISREAFKVERTDITNVTAPLVAMDSLGGENWTAARTLASGTTLTVDLVERPNAANRGDAVRFRYERGAVAIDLVGEARERGAVGDVIRVYSSDTRSTHRVLMTAPGEGIWSRR